MRSPRAGPATSCPAPCSTGSARSTGCPSRPPPTPCAAPWSTRCWRTSSTCRPPSARPSRRAPAGADAGRRCSRRSRRSPRCSTAGEEGTDVDSWLVTCREVLDRYFTLEDPRRLEPAERELYVETLLDSRAAAARVRRPPRRRPRRRIRVVDYKGLAVDTPLPAPDGWTTMGEVEVGDRLFGSDGRPTVVTRKSGVHRRPCYRVTFRDGSSVVCDNVHLWSVVTSHRQEQTSMTVDTDALFALHHELKRGRSRLFLVGRGRPGSGTAGRWLACRSTPGCSAPGWATVTHAGGI